MLKAYKINNKSELFDKEDSSKDIRDRLRSLANYGEESINVTKHQNDNTMVEVRKALTQFSDTIIKYIQR